MTTDVVLNNDAGYMDISFTETGDISTDQTLDTAILMSIYEEMRASEGEMPMAKLRRGWIGNESTPDFEQGSKLWLFSQERLTGSVLAEIAPVVRNALQWLIDDGIAENVEVEAAAYQNGRVTVPVTLYRPGSPAETRYYELWDRTGNF